MKFGLEVQCPGCKLQKTPVKFKRPRLLDPSFANFQCETCESYVAVTIAKKQDDKDRVSVKVRLITKGATLLALEEDERKHLQDSQNQD